MKKQLLALSAGLMAVAGLRAQCSPISAPFIETFTGTSAPACWNTSYTAGDGWDFNPSSYNPGYEVQGTADHTNGAVGDDFAFIDFSSPTDVNVVLESPEIDVTGITTPTLRFYHISHCVNYFANLAQHNELNIEAWDGSAWVLVDLVQGENGPNWTDYYYDLTAYVYNTNFIKFRFRGEVGQNTNYAYYNDLLLDDVEIFDGSTYCFAPTGFNVLGATGSSVDLDWTSNGTDFFIEYGAPGFTPGAGTFVSVSGQTNTTVNGLTAGNTYDFYVYQNCTGLADTSVAVGPVTETAQCSPVIDFMVNSVSTSDADLSWISSGANFIVEYGAEGFNPGSGTYGTVTSNNTQTLTGLTANSFYDAYVRVICGAGDTSIYYGPVSFNTYGLGQYMDWDNSCSPLGFVDITSTGTNLNFTYSAESSVTSPFDIVFQNTLAQDITVGLNGGIFIGGTGQQINGYANFNTIADGYAYAWADYLGEQVGNVYWDVVGSAPNRTLIFQWANVCNSFGNAQSPTVNFEIQIVEATQEIFYVYDDVVFGGANSSDDYGNNADIGIAGPNQDYTISTSSDQYLQENTCVRFFYTDCPNVTDIQINTYDYDQIGLTWSAGLASETNWTVEWGPTGFTPGSGLGTMTTTATNATITGLTQLTDYDVYVYADCDPTAPLSSNGIYATTQTAPLCANPFGIGATSVVDSVYAAWSWQPNGSGLLPTDFNVTYVPSGQDVYGSTATEVQVGGADFYDSILDQNLIASGIYDIYVQTVCNSGDTSVYSGPINFLAFMDNDSSCFAQELQVDGNPYLLYNNGAQLDAGVQAIAPPATGYYETDGWYNQNMYRTTWYTFTAPASGDVMISGTDVNWSGKMAVYETTDCGDYNQFNLIGANDNGVLFGNTAAPEWAVCGLTPGQTYYLLHSSNYNSQGNFSIRLTGLDFEAGTNTGVVDACIGDTVDLFNGITGYDVQYGVWNDLANTAQMVSPNDFATSVLAAQTYDFEYRVSLGCSYDSIVAQVKIFPPSSAGNDGSINVCMNQPINLTAGLSGNADLGGTWYDPQDVEITQSLPLAGNFPGQFNYDYVAGNGVCPDDTALVVVIVDGSCDWMGLDDVEIEGISVFPNPTSDVLNITSVGNHEALNAQIVDVNGRIVSIANETLVAGGALTLPVEGLETGVYILKLYNNSIENSFRVVIK